MSFFIIFFSKSQVLTRDECRQIIDTAEAVGCVSLFPIFIFIPLIMSHIDCESESRIYVRMNLLSHVCFCHEFCLIVAESMGLNLNNVDFTDTLQMNP